MAKMMITMADDYNRKFYDIEVNHQIEKKKPLG